MEGIENYKNTGLYGNALRKFRDSEELLNYAAEEYCFKILDLKANDLITMDDYKAERKVVNFFSERENVVAIINIYTDLMQRKQHEAAPARRLQKNISKSTDHIQAR